MLEIIWSIRLKFAAMIKEIKWNLSLNKYNIESFKEGFSTLGKLLVIQTIVFASDLFRFMQLIKEFFSKKIIFIPLVILFFLFGFYLSFISGKADKVLFEEKIFPKLYYDTAIEIRDLKSRFAGTMAQPQSLVLNPSLFITDPPELFWSLLKEKYDPQLNFDSNATTFYDALLESGGYFNGVDVWDIFKDTKTMALQLIWEQNFNIRPHLTLTQQLIQAFLKRHPLAKESNNIKELQLAKTFFHQMKKENGSNFKAWLLSQKSWFFVDGKGYGFKDCVEIFFGKPVDSLTPAQEAILVAMYAMPYRTNLSLLEQQKAWKKIKEEAMSTVNNSELIKNKYKIVSDIKKMPLPKLPYFPDALMEVVGQITSRNQEEFSSLPTRSKALLGSSKEVISQELDRLYQTYGISPQNRLVTKVAINFDLNDNFYFNHYMKSELEPLNLSRMWVSIVNEEGKMIRLYQQDSTQQYPPQIGNIGKVFSALLFADRGDKYYTQYCKKEAKDEIAMEEGFASCPDKAWIEARRVFSSEKMLPIYDGFIKYKQRDKRGENIYYTPIYMKKIEALYQNLALVPLQNNEPRVDLGAGKLQMTPLDMQVALHKITQLLYHANKRFNGLKLIKSLEYHDINESIVESKTKLFSLDSPEQVSPTFANFFTKEKRVTLQTLFKTPIYKSYGSLQWLKNYVGIKFVFAQESHKNGTHWLVGAFKKAGKYYSFTIYLGDKNLESYEAKRYMKKILESTLKSVNKAGKMKFEYMKKLFRD